MTNFPLLFSPLHVGNLIFKNRIETGPMSIVETDAKEGLTPHAISFYENLAAGGAAVVTVGESIVPTKCGKTHPQQIMLGRDEVRFSLKKVTDAIHAHNAYANIEINHGGAMADPAYNNGNIGIGPVDYVDSYGDRVLGMTPEMMDEVADAFADAAQTCYECGFDMVMIHCGHGWLLHQFLSPLSNTRTDEFGGTIEGRAKFPLMVIDRVRARVGNRLALEVRVSGSEFCEGGLEIDDVASFCQMCESKVDIINISAGAPWTTRMAISMFEPRGINSELSAVVKEKVHSIPVTTVGGYADPALMERHLEEGRADGFILGRSILADPQLPKKARLQHEDQIYRCLRCYVCNESQYYGCRTLMCSINPTAGREYDHRLFLPHPEKKKIYVIGGGPAGLKAASTAAGHGHSVTLFEKTDKLGGWLNLESHIPFKKDMYLFSQTLEKDCRRLGVAIHTNTSVTREFLENEAPDIVICAIGSSLFIPPIPGVDLPHVKRINQFPFTSNNREPVVIIGGGLVGCELALYIAMQGNPVTILEMKEDLAMDATHDHRRFLMAEMEKYDIQSICHSRVTMITQDHVQAAGTDGQVTAYSGATVVLAAGLCARTEEAEALRSSQYDFIKVGDCVRVRNIFSAVREGFDAATYISDLS